MALLKLPSAKKAQDVIQEMESKYVLVENRYASLLFSKFSIDFINCKFSIFNFNSNNKISLQKTLLSSTYIMGL